MQSIAINEGINLHHIRTDKFRTCTCALVLRNSLTREDTTKNALLPMILRRGTSEYRDMQSIQTKLEELYGAIFDANVIKKGEEQLLQFYMECIDRDEFVYESVRFLKEAALNPLIEDGGFSQAFTDGEKSNLSKKINARQNDKKEYAKLRCIEEMCKNERFGIYGDGYAEDIEPIDRNTLYGHYRHMLETAPIDFFVIGNTDTQALAESIRQSFDINRTFRGETTEPSILQQRTETRFITEETEAIQGKLCMGIRTNVKASGDEFFHLQLANEIFGGSAESKLFLNVREKESLCYYVNSFIYRFKSIILVQSGVEKSNFEKTHTLISQEFENLRNGTFTQDDLEKAKLSLINKFRAAADYQSQTMDFYLTKLMLNDSDELQDIIDRISRATVSDCTKSLANAFIDTVFFLSPCGGEY